jgi:hypothetical protein
MNSKNIAVTLLVMLLLSGLAACVSPVNDTSFTPIVSTNLPEPTAAQTETPLFQTPAATRPSPACFPSVQNRELPAETYEAFPIAILSYLNNAGSPVALSDHLNIQGAAAQPVSVAVADFSGDGRDDVAVALVNPTDPTSGANLVVYNCIQEGYELVLNMPANEMIFLGFHIWFWQDLDADDAVELVVSQRFCGAHTCFDDLMVLSWDGAVFNNRLEGSTAEIPHSTFGVLDVSGDGIYQIEAASGGIGSVGAGPQRSKTFIWRLNAETNLWRLDEERSAPSNFRIHILHDADDASSIADYENALMLYRRVIEDVNLDEWTLVEGNAALAAYARYRIFAIAVALEDRPAADAALAEMETEYPVGSALHDFVEMAILFRNAYASGGLGSACTGAAGFAESHADVVLEDLGSQIYGYANRDYTGASMCPAPVIGQ